MILGLHHAQITVPIGAEDAARRFFRDVLGLREVPKPPVLAVRGGFWLQAGAAQIHVGVEDGVDRRRTKAHVALEVDDLAAMRARLEGLGIATQDGEAVPGLRRFELRDPFGNRIELVQRVADA
jgi:catechol 2,3-dioxygenase-like lactoylglutathione lyase family enzyme